MSCIFTYDKDNKIKVSANTQNPITGERVESVIFNKLVTNPLLSNEQAVQSYYNVFSKKITNTVTTGDVVTLDNEVKDKINTLDLTHKEKNVVAEIVNKYNITNPSAVYESNGIFTDSVAEALKNSDSIAYRKGVYDSDKHTLENLSENDFYDLSLQNLREDTGELKVLYKTSNNEIEESYLNAIKKTEGSVEVGFMVNENSEFISIASINGSKDNTTYEGVVNRLIADELISDKKEFFDGEFRLVGLGQNQASRHYTAHSAVNEINKSFGVGVNTHAEVTSTQGHIDIYSQHKEQVFLTDNKGVKTPVDPESVYEDFINGKASNWKDFDGATQIFIGEFVKRNKVFNFNDSSKPIQNKKKLAEKLLSSLSKLGISITSIEEYNKRYRKIHGVDPDVEALADIAERVIAFAEGNTNVENLTEETAHFIIEGFHDQSVIDELASQVHTTKEWQEHSVKYRNKYKSQASSESELERLVRREILGKILKNKLLNSESSSEDNPSFVKSILDMFVDFVSRLQRYFNPSVKSQIDSVLDDIAERVLNDKIGDVIDSNLYTHEQKTFFNVRTKMDVIASKLNDLSVGLQGVGRVEVGKVLELMDAVGADNVEATLKIGLSYFNKHAKDLINKYNRVKTGDEKFSDTDLLHTITLTDSVLPLLQEMRQVVGTTEELKGKEQEVIDSIDEVIKNVGVLQGSKQYLYKNAVKRLVDSVEKNPNLTEEVKKQTVEQLENALEQVGWFRNFFGILQNSNNIYLNALAKIVNNLHTETNSRVTEKIRPFVLKFKNSGLGSQVYEKLVSRDKNGNLDGYIISHVNRGAYEEDRLTAHYNAYVKAYPELSEKHTLEDFIKDQKNLINDYQNLQRKTAKESEGRALEIRRQIEDEIQDWMIENSEMPMQKAFYLRQRIQRNHLNLSDATNSILMKLRSERWDILRKYLQSNGKIDYSKITDTDKDRLEALRVERLQFKNIVDSKSGAKKEGVLLQIAQELQKLDAYNALSFSKNLTEDVKSFNEKYGTSVQEGDIKIANRQVGKDFLDLLYEAESTEGSAKAFEILTANGAISFNERFWDSFTNNSSRKVLEQLLERDDHDSHAEIVEVLEKMEIKNNLLRQYAMKNNPSEIDGSEMEVFVKEHIRRLEDEISTSLGALSADFLELRELRKTQQEVSSESTTNMAYEKALEETLREGGSELSLIIENTSFTGRKEIGSFQRNLNKGIITPAMQRFMTRHFKLDKGAELSESQIREILYEKVSQMSPEQKESVVIAYGKTKIGSYFKRLAPAGYESLMKNLKEGKTSVVELVQHIQALKDSDTFDKDDVRSYLNITVDPSWMEDVGGLSENNPNYNSNLRGLSQPKLEKYENKDFYKLMGIKDRDAYLKDPIGYTQGNETYEFYKSLIDLKREGLELYGENYNSLYTLPQYSKGSMEKTENFFKDPYATTKNALNDIMSVRVDSKEYGEQDASGQDYSSVTKVRVLPKYGLAKIEEKSDLSTELVSSYARFVAQATAYDVKAKSLDSAHAIGIALEQKQNEMSLSDKRSGKWLFEQTLDHHFYGISNTRKWQLNLAGRKVDLGKTIQSFNAFVSGVNLKYNPFVALTSLTTGQLNLSLWAREYFDKSSYDWALGELRKLTPEVTSDMGSTIAKSRLYRLAEYVGVDDISERLKNEAYNKGLRLLGQSGHALNEMANFPIKYRILLATLDDVRLVDGKFIQSKVFFQLPKNQGKSREQLVSEWESYREDSLYNAIETLEDGTIKLRDDISSMDKNVIHDALNYVAGITKKANSETDGTFSNTEVAQIKRDALLSNILMHRGFISLNFDKRFKNRHVNLVSGQIEEGSYRQVFRVLGEMYKGMENKSVPQFITEFKQNFDKLSKEDQKLMYQVAREWAVLAVFGVMGSVIAGVADDDDNKDNFLIQASSYIFFRTFSEYSQSHPFTSWNQILEIMEDPFMSLGMVTNFVNPEDWSLEEVKSGKYEGHSKLYRKFAKMTYARQYYNLLDVYGTSKNYRKNNRIGLFGIGTE